MPNITSLLTIFFALALGVLTATFSGLTSTPSPTISDTSPATSTLSVVSSEVSVPTVEPNSPAVPPTTAASETKRATAATNAKPTIVPTTVPIVIAPAPEPTAAEINAGLDASAAALRAAVVNILCYAPAGGRIRSISGSGVIVDPKGIILTNAHIAQYFLLLDKSVSCVIRSGSPAVNKYRASLIYIPTPWINANATVLTKDNPTGTGEYDFAFLAITKSATRDELPATYSYIPLTTIPPNTGTPVVIAGYPAQFLEFSQIQSSLSPTVVFGSIKDVFTYTHNTIDVVALGGSVAAQEGSSGGGVANASGDVVATITTSTTKGPTSDRALSAITASYIRSAYASETGEALDLLLSKATSTSIFDFASKIPELEAVLSAQLQ